MDDTLQGSTALNTEQSPASDPNGSSESLSAAAADSLAEGSGAPDNAGIDTNASDPSLNPEGDPANSGDPAADTAAGQQQRKSESVPYDRFAEVNTKAQQAEAQLSEMRDFLLANEPGLAPYFEGGRSLKHGLELALAESRRNQEVYGTIREQHAAVDAAVENGDISPEWGEFVKGQISETQTVKPQITDYRRQQAEAQATSARDSILREFPDADADVVMDYLLVGNAQGARQVAERHQARIDKVRVESEAKARIATANLTAEAAKRSAAVVPERAGGEAATTPSKSSLGLPDGSDPDAFFAKLHELGRATERRRGS